MSIFLNSFTDLPRVVSGPKDSSSVVNQTLKLPCYGTGTPAPIPMWSIAGRPQPLGPGWAGFILPIGSIQDNNSTSLGVAKILDDGSLEVSPTSESLGGAYTCMLVSEAGGVHKRAWITMVKPENCPPPIIIVPPKNQTLPVRSHATLSCIGYGAPNLRVTWYKDSETVIIDGDRIRLTTDGDLYFTSKFLNHIFS